MHKHDNIVVIWGGFSVNNATLNRFFSLHYLLPFVLSALALMHMHTLNTHGCENPEGIRGEVLEDTKTLYSFTITS